MLEHSIHHRGQLTVYFRLLGVKPEVITYII
ncbi:MAG: DinB family protein [Candidatus Thorarchaeota archaeon]